MKTSLPSLTNLIATMAHFASRPRAVMQFYRAGKHCRWFFHQALTWALIFSLACPPTVLAAGITPDQNAPANKRPHMDVAANGVSVVNIAAPSASGLSHNQYRDFNVEQQGAILNNASKAGISQLGGGVMGNPNIAKSNAPAKTILNEVTGANRSRIQGYIEVFGPQADVILANPSGITVNGGGFINTGNAMLTTGKPAVDGSGKLTHFDVRQGNIVVEGQGINASNLTGFDLVSRAAEVNANLYAQDLTVVTGQNSYDPRNKTVTPLQSDGSPAPRVAIDSTALGGMYAGRITLTSTDQGVGVNLQGLVQSQSDLSITGEGKIAIRAGSAQNTITMRSNADTVSVSQVLQAGNDIILQGKNVEATAATIVAEQTISASASKEMRLAESRVGANSLHLHADALFVSDSRVASLHNADLKGDIIDITGGLTTAGKDLTVTARNITLSGDIPTPANLDLVGTKGSLYAGNALTLLTTENLAAHGGIFGGEGQLQLQGQTVSFHKNTLYSGNTANITASGALSFTDVFQKTSGNAALQGRTINVQGGSLNSAGDLSLRSAEEVALTGNTNVIAAQKLAAGGNPVQLEKTDIPGKTSPADISPADTPSVTSPLASALPQNVTFASLGNLTLLAPLLTFSGVEVKTEGNLAATAAIALSLNDSTSLIAEGDLAITAGTMNLQKSSASSKKNLTFSVEEEATVDGESSLLGFSGLHGVASNLIHSGLTYSGGALLLNVTQSLFNKDGGVILASGDMTLEGVTPGASMKQLHNQASSIESLDGSVFIAAETLLNDGGVAKTRKVFVGSSYVGLGTSIPGFHADGSRNELNDRDDLHSKVRKNVRAHLARMEAKHGIPAHRPNKGDGMQEWIYEYRDEIAQAPTPSWLMAGKDMNIKAGTVTNTLSHINAGNNLTLQATSLTNQGVELSSYHDVFRRFLQVGRKKSKKVGGAGESTLKRKTNTHFSASKVTGVILSSITAAENLVVEVVDSFNNSTLKAGEQYVGKASGTPAFNDLNITGQMNLTGFASTGQGSDATLFTAAGSDGLQALGIIPPTGLFTLSSNPNHPYLIETNKKLASLGYFYGSDYFFTRLGFNHKNEHHAQLLGDAFYETRLVREQVMAKTGKRYLFADVTSDGETMHRLLDNAAEQGKALSLSVGIALNPEQIANLTKDIIWLEEQTYMGHQVLVPRLYLCEGTRAALAVRGSVVAGETVQVTANHFQNTGQISGDTVRIASVADLVNAGGDIFGKTSLLARSDGSIINRSGSIGGGDITLAAAQGIRAETATAEMVRGRDSQTVIHQVADITGTGTVRLQTPGDIELFGARINGDTAVLLTAGNDLTMSTVAGSITHTAKKLRASQTGQLGSLVAGSDVQLKADHDVTLIGSHVVASNNAELAAGRNLTMQAARGEDHYYNKTTTKGGFFGGGSSSIEQRDRIVNLGSSIVSGGSTLIKAGVDAAQGLGHIVMQASSGSAQGDMYVTSTGNVILAAADDSYFSSKSSSKSGFLSSKSKSKAQGGTTSVGSSLDGHNITIAAGDNVLATGSKASARNDLTVTAEKGDVIIAAAQDTSWEKKTSKKSKSGIFGSSSGIDFHKSTQEKSATTTETNQASLFTAGHDVKITSGRDVGTIGSVLFAENDLNIQAARDVNLIPGRETTSSQYSKKTSSAGISFGASKSGVNAFIGHKSVEKGVERTGDYTAGSFAGAGNDVTIQAGRDVNQVGSHIQAGQDASINAQQDWNMTASYDRETLHQYVKTVQSGISVALQQNVSGTVETLIDLPSDMTAGKGGAGYSALTAGSAGLRAVDAVKGTLSEAASVSANIGSSFSKTDYKVSSSTARPSSVTAGRDIKADSGRDILIEGGQIAAGRDIALATGNDLIVTSAKDSGTSKLTSASGSGGVGVKAGYGSGGAAFGINVSAQAGGAGSSSKQTSHTNAQIVAGETLSIKSGRDTTVAGAHLEGDKVKMDVGRDLTVASLQDHFDSKNFSWNAGADVTIGYGVMVSGNIGMGQGKAKSDWVGQQTSIVGKESTDIYVENNTHIKGAIIATEPGGKLTLNTNTLTFEEIKDKNKGESWSASVSVSKAFGGGGFDKGQEKDLFKPYDYTTNEKSSAPYIPNSISGHVASHDVRGVLRPTVTEGDIIVRSNSNAATDGSLDGLNRDITRSREITKNKETYTDIYISPAAIKTVIDTVTNLTSELKGSADEAIKLQQDKAVQEYEKSGKPDGDLFVAMVYKGVDPNVASFLVQQEGFSDILRTQIALNDAIDANSFTQDSFNAEYQPSQSSKRQTLGQAVLLNTVKLGEFIESIPYKEEREAAKKAIQLVTGGPIKFVIAFGIDQAISYLDKVSDNVLSKGYAEVLDNITSKLWTGSYKEEHFEKIGPDGAVFKGELVTIEGEQRVMDAKRPFLAEGISAIVGLAGITKAVKGKAQESKPKSHAGDNQSNTSGAKGQGPKINGQQSDPVKVKVEATPGNKKFAIPAHAGTAQSRINVAKITSDNGHTRGFDYAMGKHGMDASVPKKSKFLIDNDAVKALLQQKDVVKAKVHHLIYEGVVDTGKFVRQLDVGKNIGINQEGKKTSLLTIITDKKGNLINAFPGTL